MAAYSEKVAKFATAGPRKNTYNDKDSRVVMRNHFSKLFPNLDIVFAPEKAKYDLIAYNKDDDIECFFELDHAQNRDWQEPTWGYYSVLERKEENMSKWNETAPVIMVWINQSMTKYIALKWSDEVVFNHELQSISYCKEEDRKNLKHPFDFHRRIPFDDIVFDIGEY